MVNKRSALIISYHFHPSNEIGARRPTALARFLAAKGVQVTVISAFGGQVIEAGTMVLPGVIAVPVQRPSRRLLDTMVALKRRISRSRASDTRGKQASASSAAGTISSRPLGSRLHELYFQIAYFIDDYKSWGRRALKAAIHESKTRPPAMVLSSSPPLSVTWVGALAARRLGVPHIADLRDPWSDVVAHLFPHRKIELKLTRAVERWIMRRADAVTSTSSTVANRLIDRQPDLASKIFIIRNGYDGTVNHSSCETNGRLAILFAGELYLNRDPFPLLHALERLLSRPDVSADRVSAIFMGRRTAQFGSAIDHWLTGKRCAAAVRVLDTQPPSVVAEAIRRATVLLNLAQGQPLSVPAKTFEHLASGKENLLLCENDSESAQLVASIPGIIQVDPRDSDALDRALLDLYERHVNDGRLKAPANQDICSFSRAAANERFWQIMVSLVPSLQDS